MEKKVLEVGAIKDADTAIEKIYDALEKGCKAGVFNLNEAGNLKECLVFLYTACKSTKPKDDEQV